MPDVIEQGDGENLDDIQSKARRELHALASDYAQLKEHAWGRAVLEDLEKRFAPEQNIFSESEGFSTHAACHRDGQRTPVIYIRNMIRIHERKHTKEEGGAA